MWRPTFSEHLLSIMGSLLLRKLPCAKPNDIAYTYISRHLSPSPTWRRGSWLGFESGIFSMQHMCSTSYSPSLKAFFTLCIECLMMALSSMDGPEFWLLSLFPILCYQEGRGNYMDPCIQSFKFCILSSWKYICSKNWMSGTVVWKEKSPFEF